MHMQKKNMSQGRHLERLSAEWRPFCSMRSENKHLVTVPLYE